MHQDPRVVKNVFEWNSQLKSIKAFLKGNGILGTIVSELYTTRFGF